MQFIHTKYICIRDRCRIPSTPTPWTLSMEEIRTRDHDSLLTPNGSEFDAECPAPPSPPPPTKNSQYSDTSWFSSLQSLHLKLTDLRFELPRSKPLFRGFERPSISRIANLTVLCLLTYPAFYVLTLVAKDKSLFVVRSIVAVWCWGIGFALGRILFKTGARHLEAASEFISIGNCDFLTRCFEQPGPLRFT